VQIGASVRGSLALERGARALALLEERDYVVPADIERLIEPVLSHRLLLTPAYAVAGEDAPDAAGLLARCLEQAPRPAPTLLPDS
jgi:MoxR-like ATPase